jgi:hypothetical protein
MLTFCASSDMAGSMLGATHSCTDRAKLQRRRTALLEID